ncbi:MAG: MFS transporter [Planctomycetes bacterium]|nr:MFS transporter [Planctomycetota bacterium]
MTDDRTMTDRLYTRQFFQVFAAVALFMTGNALQFHFGQYVAYLGYGMDTLGLVLSIAMIGTLLLRLQIGSWIDRYGCRPTWVIAGLLVALNAFLLQWVQALWLVVLLRALMAMATATVMTTVAVFAAQIAPPKRRAESIGTMGLAGFMGMILGPTLGDWIFSSAVESIWTYRLFFGTSAVCSLASCVVMLRLKLPPKLQKESTGRTPSVDAVEAGPSQFKIIVKHWPGIILLVGALFAMVFCVQSLFLERLAEERGFKDIKLFFLVYCPTAMAIRILLRRMPERIGRSRILLVGLLLQACGLLSLAGVVTQWHLVLPSLLMGAGHSLIFPSMVDLAAEKFPIQHRGAGTSLILGAGDLGMLIGFAALGGMIETLGFDASLRALALAVVLVAAIFALVQRRWIFTRIARSG